MRVVRKRGGLCTKATLFLVFLVGSCLTYCLCYLHLWRSPALQLLPYDGGLGSLLEAHGAVLVGHINTDTDAVCAAVAAADMFGGLAARASDLNGETAFVLEYFGIPLPPDVGDLLHVVKDKGLVLVDHNQLPQVHKSLPKLTTATLKALIDHHAVQSLPVTTDFPIRMDIRPVGSTCTVLMDYLNAMPDGGAGLSRQVLGCMLAAILSDTLGLTSPTTTNLDVEAVNTLSKRLGEDWRALTKEMLAEKSRYFSSLSSFDLVRKDMKLFTMGKETVIVSVAEITGVSEFLDGDRIASLCESSVALTAEYDTQVFFFVCVDTTLSRATMLTCNDISGAVSAGVFGPHFKQSPHGSLFDLGANVSRKKNIVPALSSYFSVKE